MMARDYYNEHDAFAAQWLRNLIAAGELPAGDVDERSIEDVVPSDLVGYRHCHFFAGIGGWAYAMRLAGWPDDVPLCTGSCPCQPFSTAGQGAGFADERHLWPAWFWLITQCQPRALVGEQVASVDASRWWDLVATDLEGAGYACAAVDLPAASVGAPHKRSRLFWVADARSERREGQPIRLRERGSLKAGVEADWRGDAGDGWMADTTGQRRIALWAGQAGHESGAVERPERLCAAGDMAYAGDTGSAEQRRRRDESSRLATAGRADVWADCDWLSCTDGTARPTQPGLQPLAHGIPNRVGTLRGAGNAIVPQVAAEVLRAWLEVTA